MKVNTLDKAMKRKVFSLAAIAFTVLLAACGGKEQKAQTATVTEEVKPSVKVAQVAVRPVDQVRDYVGTVQAEVKNNIAPQAPVHCLVVPKEHIASVDEISTKNADVVAHIFTVIPQIAEKEGLSGGYRVVSNCGADAGQTVPHLHFHILGGKQLALEMA